MSPRFTSWFTLTGASTTTPEVSVPIGFTFIEQCHREQLCVDVPIVVISAVQDALDRVAHLAVHATLAKPFDLDEVVRLVSRYAGGPSNGV